MSPRKTQLSVFLEPQVLAAARERAREMKLSMSAVVAAAAKESLLSAYRSEREQEILKAVERNFYALRRLDQRVALEVQVLKEMLGLGMPSFFNHTTPVPEATKAAALLSGKHRFHGYLDMLAKNLRRGESILGDLPTLEVEMPKDASTKEPAAIAPQKQSRTQAFETPSSGKTDSHAFSPPAHKKASHGAGDWALFEPSGEK